MRIIKTFPYEPVISIKSFYTAFEAVREVGFVFDGESHDSWECVFVLDGYAGITAGETAYMLKPGQAIFHPPCEFHKIRNDGEVGLKIIIISFVADHFPLKEHALFSFPSEEHLKRVLSDLQSVFITSPTNVTGLKENATPREVQLAVNGLEHYLLGLIFNNEERVLPKYDKRASLYTRAIEHMRSNISRRISVEEIASGVGVSISSLQKLFKRFTGMGVAKFYENMIMEKAGAMIKEGRLVKETSIELGYDDQNYFSTAFKRHFGVSPTKYAKI
jgi:AraC-like DNA-binding protein